jgi:hypothetical protein
MAFQEGERGSDGNAEAAVPTQGFCVRIDELRTGEQADFRKIDTEGKMKYTFTQKNLTLQDANRALMLLWGTIDDDNVDPDYLDQFVKDRITLYQMLDKEVRITLGIEFVQ